MLLVSFGNIGSNGVRTGNDVLGVRPLITLSSSSLDIDTENPGDGSASAPWNIVKK